MVSPLDPIASLRAALRGHYDIEREIGQGAFATVYLARDLKHERKVALKVLNAAIAEATHLDAPEAVTGSIHLSRNTPLLPSFGKLMNIKRRFGFYPPNGISHFPSAQ